MATVAANGRATTRERGKRCQLGQAPSRLWAAEIFPTKPSQTSTATPRLKGTVRTAALIVAATVVDAAAVPVAVDDARVAGGADAVDALAAVGAEAALGAKA